MGVFTVRGGSEVRGGDQLRYLPTGSTTYSTVISNLGADHHWKFDGNSNDAIGSANGTDTSILHTGSPIARDATNSAHMNARGDRVALANTTTISNSSQSRKAIAGWFMVDSVELPFCRIYGEGNTTNFQLVLLPGNFVTLEVRDGSNWQVQVYGGIALKADRSYHFCAVFEGSGYGNEVRFYIDGVEQTAAIPTNRQPGAASLAARNPAEFGDPAGTVSMDGTTLLMQSPGDNRSTEQVIDAYYQHWCAWGDEDDAVMSAVEVRRLLFEAGALAEDTVATGTESAMQTALDSDGQTAVNAPCVIEIEAVSGGGDFELELNGQDFDSLASIHIRYNGTADTLTIIDDGTTGVDPDKLAAPFGGSIELKTKVGVKVTAKDAADSTAINGARVLLEADTGGPLAAGTDILSGTTNVSGVIEDTAFQYESDQPVTGKIRKGTSAPYYKESTIVGTITSDGFDLTVLCVEDA